MSSKSNVESLVEARIAAILSARPGGSRPADKALQRVVGLYADGAEADYNTLVKRRDDLDNILKGDIPEASTFRTQRRSLSRRKAAAILMVYEPRPFPASDRYIISGYQYTIILKSSEIWFLCSLDPGGIQAHLLKRICERQMADFNVANILDSSSNIWNPLLWMRSRRVREGRGFIPHDFFTPFEGGLFFGHYEKLTDAEGAAPRLAVVSKGPQRNSYLPDAYAQGGVRVWAQTNTFVDASKLKSHQATLHDRLVAFVLKHRSVVDALKFAWKISADSNNADSNEFMGALGVSFPKPPQIELMCDDLERIVDSEEWQKEANFSKASRERHRADVVRRGPPDAF